MLAIGLLLFQSGDKDKTQNKDKEQLTQLFTKIKSLAESSVCGTEDYDLNSIAYGARGCGGPVGFLAYSTSINVSEFEKLIAEYTQLEKDYNKKWAVVSTCELIAAPKSVTCENGKPKLVY